MKIQHFLPVLLSIVTLVAAQEIIPSSGSAQFPECGTRCAVLLQAEQACGASANQGQTTLAVENCFCQFSTVQPLYSAQDSVCVAECITPNERQLIKNWFTSFCNKVAQNINPLTATAAATATKTSRPTSTVTFDPNNSNETRHQYTGTAWFARYWRWIVMVIVLFFGLLALGLFAVWFKKRRQQKRKKKSVANEKRLSKRLSGLLKVPTEKPTSPSPQPPTSGDDLWGPHQHMAASQGYQYDAEHYGEAGRPQHGQRSTDSSRQGTKRNSRVDKSTHVEVKEFIDEIAEVPPNPPARAPSRSQRQRPEEMDLDLREAERRRAQEGRSKNANGNIGLAS